MRTLTCMIFLLISIVSCFASEQDITPTERSEIIDKVIDNLANRYVDPNLGKKAAEAIKQKKEKDAYNHLNKRDKLIQVLINDMYEITNDKHLQLVNSKNTVQPVSTGADQRTQQIVTSDLEAMAENKMIPKHMLQQLIKGINYGFKNAKVLDDNIAYLDIREFCSPQIAPEIFKVIDDTIKPMLNCSAVILDLRFCSTKHTSETVMYMASYLFGSEESFLLYELYDRENQKTAEFRTRTDIPQKRMSEVPVYILVGPQTSSASEMLAYGLQKLGRAKIIGENSSSTPHGTESIDIGHGIMMVLPVNRLAHVKTKTNWQVTGVIPDVTVKADQALNVAQDIVKKAKQNDK